MQSLYAIRDGNTTLQFRRWTRPSVKQGTLLKTAIGQIEIQRIDIVKEHDISENDSRNAGFDSREALLKALTKSDEGEIYKIAVRYHSEDPRIKLRNDTALTDEKFAILIKKLQRFDSASKEGPWTRETLNIIDKYPSVVSTELARHLGRERMWLKLNIRKLKNLGLTISHDVGYEISPLGKEVLRLLK